MDSFLNRIFFDNSIRSYLLVAGIILLVVIFKKYVSRYIASLLFRLVKKFARGVDKVSFVNLVIAPLKIFLLILVIVLAVEHLNFPKILEFTVYKTTSKQFLETISIIILIIAFIWLLLRIIDFIAMILKHKADLTPDPTDDQLVVFFKDFFKVLIIINGVLMVLKFGFNFQIGSLITALSIGGAAIALATRESLENLIASFIIFFDKPFAIGDQVKVQHITGTVEKIGLRSTRIRTEQKTFVTVPNKQMVDSIMDNLSLRTQRRGFIQLELHAETAYDKIQQFIIRVEHILTARQDKIENYSVFLADINKNVLLITVEFYMAPIPAADFNAFRQQVNLAIIQLMEEMKIRLAYKETETLTVRE